MPTAAAAGEVATVAPNGSSGTNGSPERARLPCSGPVWGGTIACRRSVPVGGPVGASIVRATGNDDGRNGGEVARSCTGNRATAGERLEASVSGTQLAAHRTH